MLTNGLNLQMRLLSQQVILTQKNICIFFAFMEKTENLQESVFLGQTITKDKKLRFYQFIDEFIKNAMKNKNVEDWDLNGTNVEIAQCFSWLWVVVYLFQIIWACCSVANETQNN